MYADTYGSLQVSYQLLIIEPHLSVSISWQATEKLVTDSKELTVTSDLSKFIAKQLSKCWGAGLLNSRR